MLYALLATLTLVAPSEAPGWRAVAGEARHPGAPGVRLWISGSDLFHRGQRVRVYYRTELDAFVTVMRVDTDGRIRVLFPRSPVDDNYAYGGATYAVSHAGRSEAFQVDDDPGVGYLFAVATEEPFDYQPLLDAGRWDARLASGGRIHGDPLTQLEELVQELLPPGFNDFDTHLVPYYVERRYDYPRFVCYDCHAYTPWRAWDPYFHWCRSYTLVVWRDPFYYYPSYWYPTWYYGGTRVVYVTPSDAGGYATRGRYVFKSRGSSDPGVDYRERSRASSPARRSVERFVRGADLGGVGSVAAPGSRVGEPARRTVTTPEPRGSDRPSIGQAPERRSTSERQGYESPSSAGRRGTEAGPRQAEPGRSAVERRGAAPAPRAAAAPAARRAPSPSAAGGSSRAAPRPAASASSGSSRPAAQPSARAAPSRGSSPAPRPAAQPSRSSGSRPSSPGLVRRRPS